MQTGPIILHNASAATFIFLVVWAMVSDASRLVIPNWVSIGLVAGYFARALVLELRPSIVWHVVVAGLVFFVALGLFWRNWFGGGDVKLLTAVSLWAGPDQILSLLLIMSIAGVALALVILQSRLSLDGPVTAETGRCCLAGLRPGWIRRGVIPYGLAIGVATLATVPSQFF